MTITTKLVIEIAVGSHWWDMFQKGQKIEVTDVLPNTWQVRYRRWRDNECYGDEVLCSVHYFLSNYRPVSDE